MQLAVSVCRLAAIAPEVLLPKLGSYKTEDPRTGYSSATSIRGLAIDSARGAVTVPGLSRGIY